MEVIIYALTNLTFFNFNHVADFNLVHTNMYQFIDGCIYMFIILCIKIYILTAGCKNIYNINIIYIQIYKYLFKNVKIYKTIKIKINI